MLSHVLSALEGQRPRVDEVVVVDTGGRICQKETRVMTSSFSSMNIRYRVLSHSSASAARNYGIICSTGDILAFLDDDSVPEPGWVRAITKAVKAGPFWFRGQCVDVSENNTILHKFYLFYKELIGREYTRQWSSYGSRKGYKMVDRIQAGNFFVSRDVLTNMHPVFDEHLFPFIAEEIDLSLRIRQSGHQIFYVPKAKIRHYFLRLGYRNIVLYSAFWYGRAETIFTNRSRRSIAALGAFGRTISDQIQKKKKMSFRDLLRKGYVLFRTKYSQGVLYNCVFLFICISYFLFLRCGTVYGACEYFWRSYVSKEKSV